MLQVYHAPKLCSDIVTAILLSHDFDIVFWSNPGYKNVCKIFGNLGASFTPPNLELERKVGFHDTLSQQSIPTALRFFEITS